MSNRTIISFAYVITNILLIYTQSSELIINAMQLT